MKLNITRKGCEWGDWTHLYGVEPESDDDTCAAHLLANGNDSVLITRGSRWTRYRLAEDGRTRLLPTLAVLVVAFWFHLAIVVRNPIALGAFVTAAAVLVVCASIWTGSGYGSWRGVRR